MTGERRINFGTDQTDARWTERHDTTNGRFIIAEDMDGATVLLEYDETAGEFVYRGPVNMSGGDISNVGTLTATSVSTDQVDVTGETYVEASRSSSVSGISASTFRNIVDTEDTDNLGEFNSSQEFSPNSDGYYTVQARAQIEPGSGDLCVMRVNGTPVDRTYSGGNRETLTGSKTLNLTSNDTVVVDVTDYDSSWSLLQGTTSLEIFKQAVHA